MKNKYLKRAHISEAQFRHLLRCFCRDYTAQTTAELVGVSRPTINALYHKFRQRILHLTGGAKLAGEVEIDESYFGARRVRGKRGRGAKGKTPVIGLLKRQGRVYTQVVSNCQRRELLPVIKGRVIPNSTIYTDGWRSYDSLVLNGYRHHRIYHQENEFAWGKNHVNGIESFWSYAKRRLLKFNGIHKSKFIYHLKESEYRWNSRVKGVKMYPELLKNFREKAL